MKTLIVSRCRQMRKSLRYILPNDQGLDVYKGL